MASRAAVPARELASIDFSSMIGGPLRAVIEAQAQAAMTSVEFIKAVGFMPADPSGDPGGTETAEPIYVSFKYPKEVSPYVPAVPATITGIQLTDGGQGYTSAPTVTIAAPSGTGGTTATATASINSAGEVASISLDDPGSGYTSAPAVTIAGPGAGGATRTATATALFQAASPKQDAVFQEMKLEVPILSMLPVPFIRVEEATVDFNAKINSIEHAETNSTFKAGATFSYKYGASVGVGVPIKAVSLSAKVTSSVNMKLSTSYQRNTSSGYKVDRTYSMNVHVRAVQDEMPAGLERLLGVLEDSIQSQPVE